MNLQLENIRRAWQEQFGGKPIGDGTAWAVFNKARKAGIGGACLVRRIKERGFRDPYVCLKYYMPTEELFRRDDEESFDDENYRLHNPKATKVDGDPEALGDILREVKI